MSTQSDAAREVDTLLDTLTVLRDQLIWERRAAEAVRVSALMDSVRDLERELAEIKPHRKEVL